MRATAGMLTVLLMVTLLAACGGTGDNQSAEIDVAVSQTVEAMGDAANEGAEEEVAQEEPTDEPEPTDTSLPPTDTPEPQIATRDNPLPFGEMHSLSKEGEWEAVFGPEEVLIGPEADARLKAVNQFNDDPGEGNQHILVKAKVRLSGDAVPDSITKYDQSVWSVVAAGRPFDGSSRTGMVMPEPEFEGEIIPPGELSGWLVFEVPETDDLFLVYMRNLDTGGFWFKLAE